jgi:hypothetical protein
MSAERSLRRASRSEGRQIVVVCTAFVALFALAGLIGSALMKPREAPRIVAQANDDEIYTGSIVFMPTEGDECWQRLIDNQTGRQWDKGFVSCNAVGSSIAQPGRLSSGDRLGAIRKGFRGETD